MIDKNDAVITAVYALSDNINEMKDKLDNLEEKLSKTITTNSLQQKDIELTKEEIKLIKKEVEIVKEQVHELRTQKDKENTSFVNFIRNYFGKILLGIITAAIFSLLGWDFLNSLK